MVVVVIVVLYIVSYWLVGWLADGPANASSWRCLESCGQYLLACLFFSGVLLLVSSFVVVVFGCCIRNICSFMYGFMIIFDYI